MKEPGKTELILFWQQSGPLILSYSLSACIPLITMSFVSRFVGSTELAAVALGDAYNNLFGTSVMIGLTQIMDVFGSRAFGANNPEEVGYVLHRATLLMFVATVPLYLIRFLCVPILLALGQDPKIVAFSAIWIRWSMLEIVPYTLAELARRFFSLQRMVLPITVAPFVTLICHFSLNHLFVSVLSLGIQGAILARVISFWFFFWTNVVLDNVTILVLWFENLGSLVEQIPEL